MSTTVQYHDEISGCVLELDGDIDIASVPDVRQLIETAIRDGCVNVVLDLARVDYADSSALGLLVWVDHALEPLGGRLVIAGANRDVTRILEISGLVGVAPTLSARMSVDEALSGLEEGPAAEVPAWSECIQAPARAEELSAIRSRVCDMLVGMRLSDASLFDVKVAVGEALANAVRHGSSAMGEDKVDVEVSAYRDRVVVQVTDAGCGFDGATCAGDDVYASSGRGVMFMRALMDSVGFETHEGGGTTVTLVKRLPLDGDGPRS
jgi:serine/threonine-protein kinase RsbW